MFNFEITIRDDGLDYANFKDFKLTFMLLSVFGYNHLCLRSFICNMLRKMFVCDRVFMYVRVSFVTHVSM